MQKFELRIAQRYKLGNKLGSGAFGEIFKCVDLKTGEKAAAKLEPASTKHPQVFYEAKILKLINKTNTAVGFPALKWAGREGDYNIMIMTLLGPSLEDLFNFCDRKFSLKTVLMLADQMLQRIEYMHNNDFIHRDIKPDNFVMGLGNKGHRVYFIDFGLSKRYRNPQTKEHIPYRDKKSLTGTARYASINTHLGIG